MKDVLLGKDLFGKKVYWKNLDAMNSLLLTGLSGSGKSYLTDFIIEQFLAHNYRVVVVSDKAKVDFKNPAVNKIDTLKDTELLDDFIQETEDLMLTIKQKVEESPHSHSRFLKRENRLLIVVDELWSVNKLEKSLKKRFEDFCELVIRQGRYLSIYIIFATQISSVSESGIPIRQCSLIITGKTDTRQLSESLFGTDIAYSSDFLRQGVFLMWDRLSAPKFIRAGNPLSKFSIYRIWILKLLKKIWTIFR